MGYIIFELEIIYRIVVEYLGDGQFKSHWCLNF